MIKRQKAFIKKAHIKRKYLLKDYLLSFSWWIENLGVVPLLLLRAFLLLPIFVFFAFLLFLVTLVLETISLLLSAPRFQSIRDSAHVHYFKIFESGKIPISRFLVKVVMTITLIFPTFPPVKVLAQTENQDVTDTPLYLTIGEISEVTVKGLSKFSIGNKTVINARSQKGNHLLIKGKGIGYSDVLLWSKNATGPKRIQVFVINKNQQIKLFEVQKSLEEVNLKKVQIGRKLGLIGSIQNEKDYLILSDAYNRFSDKLDLSQLRLEQSIRSKKYSELLRLFSRHGIHDIVCTPGNPFINCETSQNLETNLKGIKGNFLITWKVSDPLKSNQQFKITLTLQQFENLAGENFSFGLNQIEGNLSQAIQNNPLSLIAGNEVSLKNTEFKSETLASPILKSRFATPVKVRIGQEIPFLQGVNNGIATQTWKFAGLGIDLKITPSGNRVLVEYKTNLSSPSDRGISTNTQESELIISKNREIALFDIGFAVKKDEEISLPLISKVPLFGSLFSGNKNLKTFKKILCVIKIEEI